MLNYFLQKDNLPPSLHILGAVDAMMDSKRTLSQRNLTIENKEESKLEWTKALSYSAGKKSLGSKTSNSSFSLPECQRRNIYTQDSFVLLIN